MLADIAIGQSPQQRIGQGVQDHIAVRMGAHAAIMGNFDAAKPDMVAGGKGVDIITQAGHGNHRSLHFCLCHAEILLQRQFDIVGIARKKMHPMAGLLHHGGIVGEIILTCKGCLAMCGKQRGKTEHLRGLNSAQP